MSKRVQHKKNVKELDRHDETKVETSDVVTNSLKNPKQAKRGVVDTPRRQKEKNEAGNFADYSGNLEEDADSFTLEEDEFAGDLPSSDSELDAPEDKSPKKSILKTKTLALNPQEATPLKEEMSEGETDEEGEDPESDIPTDEMSSEEEEEREEEEEEEENNGSHLHSDEEQERANSPHENGRTIIVDETTFSPSLILDNMGANESDDETEQEDTIRMGTTIGNDEDIQDNVELDENNSLPISPNRSVDEEGQGEQDIEDMVEDQEGQKEVEEDDEEIEEREEEQEDHKEKENNDEEEEEHQENKDNDEEEGGDAISSGPDENINEESYGKRNKPTELKKIFPNTKVKVPAQGTSKESHLSAIIAKSLPSSSKAVSPVSGAISTNMAALRIAEDVIDSNEDQDMTGTHLNAIEEESDDEILSDDEDLSQVVPQSNYKNVSNKLNTTKKATGKKLTYLNMVLNCLQEFDHTAGVTVPFLKKYMNILYDLDFEEKKTTSHLLRTLKQALSDCLIIQLKGTGLSGSFRIARTKYSRSQNITKVSRSQYPTPQIASQTFYKPSKSILKSKAEANYSLPIPARKREAISSSNETINVATFKKTDMNKSKSTNPKAAKQRQNTTLPPLPPPKVKKDAKAKSSSNFKENTSPPPQAKKGVKIAVPVFAPGLKDKLVKNPPVKEVVPVPKGKVKKATVSELSSLEPSYKLPDKGPKPKPLGEKQKKVGPEIPPPEPPVATKKTKETTKAKKDKTTVPAQIDPNQRVTRSKVKTTMP